ncbi:MAG: Lrp/AsnC family transcriptional regulator [Candidatus Micrarchaeota archaeon]
MSTQKLDLKDRSILFELDADAAQPASKIAKKVRLSKQVVNYRIRNLQRAGVLKECCLIVDMGRFGYTVYKIYLKYRNINRQRENMILSRFCKNPFVGLVETCDGRWDMIIGVWAKSVENFREISDKLFRGIEKYFSERTISIIERADHCRRAYLVEKPGEGEIPFFGGTPANVELDALDKKIMWSLSIDARKSMVEVATEVNENPQVVRRKLQKLKQNGVIKGARIVLDKRKINILSYKVVLTIENLTPERENELLEYIRQEPHMIDFVKCLGNWNFEIDIEIPTYEDFHYLMLETRNRFSDIIKNYESLLIFEEKKYNYFPMGPA